MLTLTPALVRERQMQPQTHLLVQFFPAGMSSSSRGGGRARLIQGGAVGSRPSVPIGSLLPGASNMAFSVSHTHFLPCLFLLRSPSPSGRL